MVAAVIAGLFLSYSGEVAVDVTTLSRTIKAGYQNDLPLFSTSWQNGIVSGWQGALLQASVRAVGMKAVIETATQVVLIEKSPKPEN